MSARIHEIAKQYNVEPKDMLAWLKEQGFVSADTKSVSSTVSKIYYDEIAKKYATAAAPVEAPAPVPVVPVAPVSVTPIEVEPSRVKLPAGVFVKSAQDVVREKEEVIKAAAAVRAAAIAAATPPPAAVVAPKVHNLRPPLSPS